METVGRRSAAKGAAATLYALLTKRLAALALWGMSPQQQKNTGRRSKNMAEPRPQ